MRVVLTHTVTHSKPCDISMSSTLTLHTGGSGSDGADAEWYAKQHAQQLCTS